ncbi:methyl-accepting chemotaxis protein [bacterium]|nr:methyl-accepting chemotaxis protein [bacterium]
MKWSIGRKISLGLGLGALLILLIGTVSLRNNLSLMETVSWVNRTNQEIWTLEITFSHLREAQNSCRGFLLARDTLYLKDYRDAVTKLGTDFDTLQTLGLSIQQDRARLGALKTLVDEMIAELQGQIDLARGSDFETAIAQMKIGRSNDLRDKIYSGIRGIRTGELAQLTERSAAMQKSSSLARNFIVFGSLIGLVLLIMAGTIITRDITRPLGMVVAVSSDIAGGDLTTSIPEDRRKDEVGELNESFRSMLANLRQQTRSIAEVVNSLAASSSEISTTVSQLAASTAETSTAVSETSTTAEEIRQTAEVSSNKAENVATLAREAEDYSRSGREALEDTLGGMSEIQIRMESIGESIMRLSEQSQAIGEIIASVDDLADQSNLLAVNAAIEAARYEDQGKGFTVVAQEIRSLADQSKQGTKKVRTILNDVQKATTNAVLAVEQGGKTVEAAMKQSQKAREAIQSMTESIADTAQAGKQIAASNQQQTAGIEQIVVAIDNIRQATTQNAIGTRQIEETTRRLAELGQSLKELVNRYKLD